MFVKRQKRHSILSDHAHVVFFCLLIMSLIGSTIFGIFNSIMILSKKAGTYTLVYIYNNIKLEHVAVGFSDVELLYSLGKRPVQALSQRSPFLKLNIPYYNTKTK